MVKGKRVQHDIKSHDWRIISVVGIRPYYGFSFKKGHEKEECKFDTLMLKILKPP